VYAPYGINETDGGFLTGLAWQVLSGKTLYQDIIYVRPPVSVWMRVLELKLLPEYWSVLGERWIFYFKVGLYSGLAAIVLSKNQLFQGTVSQRYARPFWIAAFGFVLSVHAYPAAAWHTVDGIFWAVVSVFCAVQGGSFKGSTLFSVCSGVALAAALLCKQSFYPLVILLALLPAATLAHRMGSIAGFLLAGSAFAYWLFNHHIVDNFAAMTNGAANGGQALQHGVVDYFRIRLPLLLPTAVLAAWAGRWWLQNGTSKTGGTALSPRWLAIAFWGWIGWLMVSYGWSMYEGQETTVPFAQIRLLFWLSAGVLGGQIWQNYQSGWPVLDQPNRILASLLLISWCASVSWGYNLPIFFSTPFAYAVLVISGNFPEISRRSDHSLNLLGKWLLFGLLLLTFRCAAEFIYRDGRRSEMTVSTGAVFPQLGGIYSDAETAALYRDMKDLSARYGPNFTTLPAFPYSNFLTKTFPPLPLDWVVKREIGGFEHLLIRDLEARHPVIFVEKKYAKASNFYPKAPNLLSDPELNFTRSMLDKGKIMEETPYFWVIGTVSE